ncbi:SERPIN domain-containing protein [Caerostris darwini]|uniref:SERPIN domain-containing protein n=1 Tax=Caerostris darwini TaxID=1538125 RepID=A0AAV4S0V8_9ARAC|nr:SERPIN domain-containing protein [Caerostris darwini]
MNAEQSTRYINLFFERNTEGRVPHILSQVPSPSTNLLLLSAIYFRGTLDMNMAQVEESRFVGRAGDDPFVMLEARKARVSRSNSIQEPIIESRQDLDCTLLRRENRFNCIDLNRDTKLVHRNFS